MSDAGAAEDGDGPSLLVDDNNNLGPLGRMHSMEHSPPPPPRVKEAPVLHRSSSMPVSPQSSIFYRNKAMSKSSRSMRFDVSDEEDDDESDHADDDSDEIDEAAPMVPTRPSSSATGGPKWHRRADSAPLPSPLCGYRGTSPETLTRTEAQSKQQISFDDGNTYQVPVGGESQPLLPGRRPDDDVEQPPPAAAPSVLKKPGSGILRRRRGGYDRAQRLAEERRLTRMAAAFLADYSASQAPTLPPDSVTDFQLFLHTLRWSTPWKVVMSVATMSLFLASCYEGGDGNDDWQQVHDEELLSTRVRHMETMLLVLTFGPVLVYSVDMLMLSTLFRRKHKQVERPARQSQALRFSSGGAPYERGVKAQAFLSEDSSPVSTKARTSRARLWMLPLALFLIVLSIETLFVVMTHSITERRVWSSALKPVVFFYSSSKARNALDAMNRVARIVFRVIFIELFLIFSFAAVACQLYGEEWDAFNGLPMSFLSMFQLSTTVVNPSLWMEVYSKSQHSAIFFIIFLVVSVFYLHSLVLSVVFQSYMDGMRVIREHGEVDREKNLELAFEALYRIKTGDNKDDSNQPIVVPCKSVRRVLMLLRPHYKTLKIQTLMNIVDPGQAGSLDYNTFRLKVPKALNTSVRSTRPYNTLSRFLEAFAAFVAVVNLVYIVLASSSTHAPLWEMAIIPTGFIITSLGILELVIRLIPVKVYRIAEAAKPSLVFDGFSICAAVVSLVALALQWLEHKKSLNYLFTGRAIDMIRCLRLNKEARDIVKRSSEVLPALMGPLALVITSTHMFTYLGMSIWGGEIVCGSNPNLTPFYDLNNFNKYTSGLITMFQVLVVNDWHAIAEVYILPYHISTALVYPFFISANLINVSVLLNTMIAFFVGAFVTRASGADLVLGMGHKMRASATSLRNSNGVLTSGLDVKFEDEDWIYSSDDFSQLVTVSVRQGFENIMRTVAGEDEDDEDDAAKLCSHVLELFESLSPPQTEKVGYLVSCQQSKSRYGNQRFQKLFHQFMDTRALHRTVGEMSLELATLLPDGHKRTIRREFTGKATNETLELTASLLVEGSSVSLFVARIIERSADFISDS